MNYKDIPFRPFTARYRPENACWMAKITYLSYEQNGNGTRSADSLLCELKSLDDCFEGAVTFTSPSAGGVVIQHQEFLIAVFNGTDEPGAWLDNLNAFSVPGPFGRIHGGFQRSLMEIWPSMKNKIRDLRREYDYNRLAQNLPKRSLPLWLTGHSMGGAIASLAAAELIHSAETFFGVYTFGQPRCGDQEFARIFNSEAKSRCFRFHNNNDIVTRIPPRLMGYRHVGTYIYITESQDLSWDPGFWYQFVEVISGVINDIGYMGLDSITDHRMKNYLKAIENWGQRSPCYSTYE